MTKVAVTEDLTREEIVDRYRKRIAEGKRTKLTRVERDQLALLLVETLIHLSEAGEDSKEVIQALCQEEIDLLEEGYPKQSINSHYLPVYTRLIREAIASEQLKLTDLNSYEKTWTKQDGSDEGTEWKHYALDFLVYDRQTQRHLRSTTTANNNQRQDHRQPVDVDAYLAKAQELLRSDIAEEVAIALCALTGRRHTEIVCSGKFKATAFPYLIRFEGQLKDATPAFDILTLIPAQEILPHLQRLKAMISHLDGLSSQDAEVRAFNTRVNHRVRKAFETTGIVPVLKGFKTVSIHRLRGVYGAIAIYFFCPPTRHEHRFLQHYLGHLIDTESQAKPNAGATQHYFHYVPMRRGKITQAMGVKLSANGPAPLPELTPSDPEVTAQDIERQASAPPANTDTDPLTSQQPAKDAKDAPAEVEASVDVASASQSQKQSDAQPHPATSDPTELDHLSSVITSQMETIAHQAQSLSYLTAEVQALRQRIEHLETERDEAIANAQRFPELQQRCSHLQQENHNLRLAQQKLNAFKALLLDTQVDSVSRVSLPPESSLSAPNGGNGTTISSHAEASPNSVTQADSNAQPSHSDPHASSASADLTATENTSSDDTSKPHEAAAVRYSLVPTKESKAQQRAATLVSAIQAWNATYPDRSFAITKGLLEHEFGINRKAASEFLEGNRQTLRKYYQVIGVANERGHNRQPGRDIQALKSFIDEVLNPATASKR